MKREEIKMLEKDFMILDHFLTELRKNDMSNWVKFSEKGSTKIFYRQDPGLKGLTVYLEKVINAPLMHLLAVLVEV